MGFRRFFLDQIRLFHLRQVLRVSVPMPVGDMSSTPALETKRLRTYKRQKRYCFPCFLTSNGPELIVATVEDPKADH
jgi:hypothetical protein